MKRLKVSLFLLIFSSTLFAATHNVHTWHKIQVKNGEWQASLRMINQEGYFVNQQGTKQDAFSVTADKPESFGFVFSPIADFDIAYTLTLTQMQTGFGFTSKACVFVLSAKGPAQPDIQTLSYNGAICEYDDSRHTGADFIVS